MVKFHANQLFFLPPEPWVWENCKILSNLTYHLVLGMKKCVNCSSQGTIGKLNFSSSQWFSKTINPARIDSSTEPRAQSSFPQNKVQNLHVQADVACPILILLNNGILGFERYHQHLCFSYMSDPLKILPVFLQKACLLGVACALWVAFKSNMAPSDAAWAWGSPVNSLKQACADGITMFVYPAPDCG